MSSFIFFSQQAADVAAELPDDGKLKLQEIIDLAAQKQKGIRTPGTIGITVFLDDAEVRANVFMSADVIVFDSLELYVSSGERALKDR